jgi:hypothetical protein
MAHERKGGCLCGAVRYVISGEPQPIAVCHCTHCQKQSGSAFSFNLFVKEEDYQQHGETLFYPDTGDSGHLSYRHFCGQCGSPILTKVSTMPGVVLVKAGTLDAMDGLQPNVEIYTDRAVKWLAPIGGTERFSRSP